MLLAENDLSRPPDDAVRRDPEARQARKIADAARSRLLACIAGPDEVVDLRQAQRMLDKLGAAQTLAEDAEDRVLVHRGLLTPAEADRRAAARRPARPARPAGPPETPGRLPPVPPRARRLAGSVLLHALLPAAAGFAGAAIARRLR